MRILMDLSDLRGGMPEFCGIVLTSIMIEKKFKAGLIYWQEVGQSFNGVVVWSNDLQSGNLPCCTYSIMLRIPWSLHYANALFCIALTPDAYEDECEFADHAGSFKGRCQFKRNCSSLSQNPIFPSHRAFILW
ncbi:hypothetical protein Hanom_Chr16g01480011 [Helianthus anomalus]